MPELPLVHLWFIRLPKYFILNRQNVEILFMQDDNVKVILDYNQPPDRRGKVCRPPRPTVRRWLRLDHGGSTEAGKVAPGGNWWDWRWYYYIIKVDRIKTLCVGTTPGPASWRVALVADNNHAKSIVITFVQVGQVSATSLPVGVRSTQKSW